MNLQGKIPINVLFAAMCAQKKENIKITIPMFNKIFLKQETMKIYV